MRHIVKVFMVAALFFVGIAHAENGPMSSDNNKKMAMCEYMSCADECNASDECTWDEGQQRCSYAFQIMHGGHGHGHGYHCRWKGYYECLRSRHCFWDRYSDSCRPNRY